MSSICLVAGDPSGDAHAARLIETLKAKQPGLRVSALGGSAMQRAGAVLLDDLTQASAIGPFDAAKHIARFVRAKRLLDAHLRSDRPDLVILVDFGDFNLPVVAPLVKRCGIPILYYISPQVWAWGRWRIQSIRRYVDRMMVFFPFEERLYRDAGIPVTWVGHPLIEQAKPSLSREEAMRRFGLNPWRRTVGLLPGSREHEITRRLPLLLATAERIAWRMPGVQFLIPKAPTVAAERIRSQLARIPLEIRLAEGSIYDALQLMEAAVVTSGTATLETALCGVPMAVVYRASWPTYVMARALIRVPSIALVNVVAQRRLVPEFIQHRAHPERIADAIVELLRDEDKRKAMQAGLREVKETLGPPGAVGRAAGVVLEMLRQTPDIRSLRR